MESDRDVEIADDELTVILGKRGSGKTELIKYFVRKLIMAEKSLLIFDVVGNLSGFKTFKRVSYYALNPHNTTRIDNIINTEKKRLPYVFILDEADRYDYFANSKSNLSDLINLGRNWGIGVIASARRTANISKDFISNANNYFVFRHNEINDLEVLKQTFGLDHSFFKEIPEHSFAVFKDTEYLYTMRLTL